MDPAAGGPTILTVPTSPPGQHLCPMNYPARLGSARQIWAAAGPSPRALQTLLRRDLTSPWGADPIRLQSWEELGTKYFRRRRRGKKQE